MLTDIGDNSILTNIPKIIHINEQPYILNKNQEGKIFLYNAICPHQHGIVDEINEDVENFNINNIFEYNIINN